MQRFTDLKVWQRSHALVLEVYRTTASWPEGERFGLVSQLRRSAVSVPSNIAEGAKWLHNRDYAHFLNIAQGSLAEVEYLLWLTRDLSYLSATSATKLLDEAGGIARMLHALRARVERET